MILCVASFVVYAFEDKSTSDTKRASDVPSLIILVVRYVAQCGRLAVIIHRALFQAVVLETNAKKASDLMHDGNSEGISGEDITVGDEHELFTEGYPLLSKKTRQGPSELVAAAELDDEEERAAQLNQ